VTPEMKLHCARRQLSFKGTLKHAAKCSAMTAATRHETSSPRRSIAASRVETKPSSTGITRGTLSFPTAEPAAKGEAVVGAAAEGPADAAGESCCDSRTTCLMLGVLGAEVRGGVVVAAGVVGAGERAISATLSGTTRRLLSSGKRCRLAAKSNQQNML
jgi:hypothetical protein